MQQQIIDRLVQLGSKQLAPHLAPLRYSLPKQFLLQSQLCYPTFAIAVTTLGQFWFQVLERIQESRWHLILDPVSLARQLHCGLQCELGRSLVSPELRAITQPFRR